MRRRHACDRRAVGYSAVMLTEQDCTVVELPKVDTRLITPKAPAIARVVGNLPCTYGKSNSWVRNVAIDVSATALAGKIRIGQAFGIIPPGTDEDGKPHKVRLYSIASPDAGEDGRGNILCTPVKRTIAEFDPEIGGNRRAHRGMFMGACSNYLCNLSVGDEVLVTGPAGKRFLLPADAERHDYVFIATGTGIAPYRGMVLQLLKGPAGPTRRDIWLLAGAPYTSDLLYHELFLEIEREFDNFHYLQAVSREPHAPGELRGIYVDRLLVSHLERLGPVLERPSTLLYLCGIAGMQFSIYRRLALLGLLDGYAVPKSDICVTSPADWTSTQMRRGLRATARCMIEVY